MAQPHLPSPDRSTTQHRLRGAASVFAAVAGGLGMLAIALALIGRVTPAKAGLFWIAVVVSLAVWLTGIWWRTDSPDSRGPQRERERRGF